MPEKLRLPLLPAVMAFAMLAVLLGLGTWQLERLEWKQALIERLETRLAEAPVPLPQNITAPQDWEFQPVTFRGEPAGDAHFPVFRTGPRGGAGYAIYRPYLRGDGPPVLVNTGWISQSAYQQSGPPLAPHPGAGLTAIIRVPVDKGLFTPDNRPQDNLWYWVDLPAMASEARLRTWLPVSLWLVPEGARPGDPDFPVRLDLPNNHLQYALTWYSLAFFLAVIFVLFMLRHRRGQ